MKITIAGQDYTSALDAAHPLTIERKLNEPSICRLCITLPSAGQSALARNQPIQVVADDGSYYFTGYLAAAPIPQYAGLGIEGPRYRMAIQAVSDECLLDQAGTAASRGMAGLTAGPLIAALAAKTGSDVLSTDALVLDTPVSSFQAAPCTAFSTTAAAVADQVRAAYRALNGTLLLSSIPVTVHPLNEADGTLLPNGLTLDATTRRSLANDITVCGGHEPSTYVTEYFLGDGITAQFNLSDKVFTPAAAQTTLIRELFNEGEIDFRLWAKPGTDGYLSLGAGGLVMQGGTGRDGDAQLGWRDPVEMGGTLLLEATGVSLADGSNGIVAGFFTGDNLQAACTAGFKVTAQQGTGAVSIQPLALGSAVGAAYAVNPSNQYALRVRVHCPECHRGAAIYRSVDDSGAIAVGGAWNSAPANLQFEIQEFVNGVAGMPVTLYEGQIATLPGTCTVIAASSTNLYGSIRALNLTNLGSCWVVTTPANGGATVRRVGAPTQSAECAVENSGRLVFYPGFTPAAGEQIAVSYRTLGRAAGRAVDTESEEQLAASGLPPVSTWIGSVTNPPARNSEDCRNAASALKEAAASVSGLWSGTYECTRFGLDSDVWPGDALEINAYSAGLSAQVIVRTVKLTYHASLPDLVRYEISFANDWAEDLAIKTSSAVPDDVWMPAPVSSPYAPNLSGVTVVAMSGGSVTIDAGTTAPVGGGFEIRRRDNCFIPGSDSDLVMRSSQPTMTFARHSAWDRFYIRMYNGSNPRNYSEFSAALIFNLPLAS
jgi:hypothetical protein